MEPTKIIPSKVPTLPPNIPSCEPLMKELIAAHIAVAELRGYLDSLPNPDLLIAPFRKREAVASSAIEGTRATVEEVMKFEAFDEPKADVTRDEKSQQKTLDIMEVLNYEEAMNTALNELKKRPIGENLLKKAHLVLLHSVRGENKDRGNFRKGQVMVGNYVPPIHTDIPKLMSNWENYLNKKRDTDPLVRIGVAHYQFEAIHPFLDGNGRIGRLIIPLFMCQEGLLQTPVLYISHFLEEHKVEYQRLLHKVDTDQEWIEWLKFFLTAVEKQAKVTTEMAKETLALYDRLKNDLVGNIVSQYGIAFLDEIFRRPIFSARNIRESLGIGGKNTVYRLIDKFQEAGVLREFKFGREKFYVFTDLKKVLRF